MKHEDITDKQKQELEELVDILESIKGRHTELVSVLIPVGQNINLVQRQLEAEKSTAANIKSKQTRTAVITALETIIRKMKEIKQTPPNGLAIFCGNISEKEGVQDIKLWVYEPPMALKTRLYRCDQTFIIEPLKEMLEVTETYGLLVIDRQHATLGLLEGKQIKTLTKLSSGVPGKIKAGGQCLSPDTLIIKDNGEIIEIKDSHNPLLIVSENFNIERTEESPVIAKWENKKTLFKITTKYPRFEIKASQEHTFFVRTAKGIEEKTLADVKEGDYLLIPEKIEIEGEEQKIDFTPIIKSKCMKKIDVPKILDENLSRLLGYYLGDGNYEIDRISFSEQRKEVAEYYYLLIGQCFKIKPSLKFREKKGYYQMRVGSRIIAQLFKSIFTENSKTLNQKTPPIILKSKNSVLASFIAGFFDAEGYVSKGRVGAGFNNERLAKQLQLLFLRLGIITSINIYDNRKNPYSKKIRYSVNIDDLESLKRFKENSNFVSKEKQNKLNTLIEKRSNRNKVRQIAVNGKEVARIIRNSGLNTRQFNCPDFFTNKKQISKDIFKERILNQIKDEELKRRLEIFYNSNLIVAKINKIENMGLMQTIDIETKNHNFIANGIIVHNSSQRFHRITEGLAKEFFRRVAEEMKRVFFDMPKLKGILIGGPIPTKEEFIEEGNLVTALKNKIIAIKDLGYTDEHGLELLVEDSQKDIAQQELIKEKNMITKFFETLGKHPDKAVYGEEKTSLALERGAVDILLLSKKLDKEKKEEFEKKANAIGAEVVIISTENQDGQQFLNLTKGIGAILRFSLE